jgi:hypothetical protein
MKKVLGFIAVSAFVFSMSSCKKTYTCECCASAGGQKYCGSATSGKMKKKDAETWCTASGSSGATCTLK